MTRLRKMIMHNGEKSHVLEVAHSDLAADYPDFRKLHYSKLPIVEKKHFVVVGHDNYHEILAESFDAIRVPKIGIVDPKLLRLIADE